MTFERNERVSGDFERGGQLEVYLDEMSDPVLVAHRLVVHKLAVHRLVVHRLVVHRLVAHTG